METDCQALRDTLKRDDLNATHARWREAILDFTIVDVRHRPGKTNTVGVALAESGSTMQVSRMMEKTGQLHWTGSGALD